MELYIGGFGEKKLDFVKSQLKKNQDDRNFPAAEIADKNNFSELDFLCQRQNKILIVDGLHLIIKDFLEKGLNQDEILKKIISLEGFFSEIIFICDEIGNGIVPMEKADRLWREVTGRILCLLAEKSKKVCRIVCGLGQVIKE